MKPTKFIEGIGNKLAERWVATLFTPAFCFWAGGFFFITHLDTWTSIKNDLSNLSEPFQITVLIVCLLVIAASAFIVQRFDLAILRFLEGYWPQHLRLLQRLRQRSLQYYENQLHHIKEQLQGLMRLQASQPPNLNILEKQARLDYQRRWLPSQPQYLMPTELGNILRAAELRPEAKYGLNAVVCWPHLWMILPEHPRNDLQEARVSLNTAVRVWLWGLMFWGWAFLVFWTPWALLALPIGWLTMLFAYRWSLSAARSYGDLLDAAFDLYRDELYKALRWPLPENSDVEREIGKRLSQYIWRGPVHLVSYHDHN
ncbi:hypothetical protein Lepto7375DRAFT_0011 [Leptolyngbya sp. PCC 7375]|nr:hypothetical protein Lepto7375DRAFT_0011 [Leptolyngbya sp. PCC 7375]